MSSDFFLENRAHQIRRLCTEAPVKYELPPANARGKLPAELSAFYELLDRICALSAVDDSAGGSAASSLDSLRSFEREIVRLRFSSDDKVKQPAVQLIKAIFADADYFSGLKPLPQYTESFAYELLFPSWLNLLTATMLPQASTGKPRLEGKRQGTLFEFLGSVRSAGVAREDDLVGYLTFIASRFDAPRCEEFLQRLVEIFSRVGGEVLDNLDSIQDASKGAKQFAQRLKDFLTVKHSSFQWPATSEYPIAYKRPPIRVLPNAIATALNDLEQRGDNWPRYFQIANPVRRLINSDQLLTTEYMACLERHPDHLAEMLQLVMGGEDSTTFLAPEGQIGLAYLIDQETDCKSTLNLEAMRAFATSLAPRLDGYNESILAFFCRQFLQDASNRKMVMDACQSNSIREQLASHITERAGQTDDNARVLEWLSCVTVIASDEVSLSAKSALQAIEAVVQNRSIGNREFSDLVEDLQANVQDAMQYLSAPIMAAGGKTPRLAALYLTLNEIAETYAATGKADNFSVVRAKYSKLTNFGAE